MNIFTKIKLAIKYKKLKFLYLGKFTNIRHLSNHFIHTERISIGDFSTIGEDAYLDGSGGIEIGSCTIIGPKFTAITANHNYDNNNLLPYDNKMISKKITIGDYCWIGRGVTIIPGVKVGKACIIATGSVVTKDIDDFAIIGGNPANVIRYRNRDIVEKLIKNNRCVNNPISNPNRTKIWI